ncbi:hypothetical protein [Gallaecimonas sp. GXIMD4217]|uniref:hypothetical protein n=1 Tax=Gallaecimonas sp. GXIMD4217 TaxID=3131927 RepID=UPI00311B2DB2
MKLSLSVATPTKGRMILGIEKRPSLARLNQGHCLLVVVLKESLLDDRPAGGSRGHWPNGQANILTWPHCRFVGQVNSYTLKQLIMDNYFFGGAAMAKDDSESPVVFPGPAGRRDQGVKCAWGGCSG